MLVTEPALKKLQRREGFLSALRPPVQCTPPKEKPPLDRIIGILGNMNFVEGLPHSLLKPQLKHGGAFPTLHRENLMHIIT